MDFDVAPACFPPCSLASTASAFRCVEIASACEGSGNAAKIPDSWENYRRLAVYLDGRGVASR
jgi:hypothetical protein